MKNPSIRSPQRMKREGHIKRGVGGPVSAVMVHVLLLQLVLALGLVRSQSSGSCVTDKSVALHLGVTTNATGHPHVSARLVQPLDSKSWQLELNLGRESCQGGQRQKVLSFTLIGAPLGSTLLAPLRKPVPEGYQLLPELRGYFRQSDEPLEWAAARDACWREGAELATPATPAEAALFVQRLRANASDGATQNDVIWLGATDSAEEGEFLTVAGEPLETATSVAWDSGSPNGGTTDNCLALYKKDKDLEDRSCSLKYPYFCKIPI